jgi:SAM-dependent methyltransferase
VKSAFRAITETAGTRADADQMAMAQLRHSLVAALATDRDLLDVACGTGYALPLISRQARSVTACDAEPANVRDAAAALPSGSFHVADAGNLSFGDCTFDVVACLESIYYFQDWRAFVHTANRLLRPGGTLVTTWPNPARPAFVRSAGSTAYPGAEEMVTVAHEAGLAGTCYGAFPLRDLATAHRPGLDALRRAVVRTNLMPGSLRLRALIKRALYRRMRPLAQISLLADPFQQLVKIGPDMDTEFAMLYFVGDKPRAALR